MCDDYFIIFSFTTFSFTDSTFQDSIDAKTLSPFAAFFSCTNSEVQNDSGGMVRRLLIYEQEYLNLISRVVFCVVNRNYINPSLLPPLPHFHTAAGVSALSSSSVSSNSESYSTSDSLISFVMAPVIVCVVTVG